MTAVLIMIITSINVMACPQNSDVSENNAIKSLGFGKLKSMSAYPSTVTAGEYNAAFEKVKRIYTPIFAKHGYVFLPESNWADNEVLAFSVDKKNDSRRRKIYISGGHARQPFMTKDTLMVTICHEVGHHLGGYPLSPKTNWPASSEGQADYYASLKCLKLMWADEVRANSDILIDGTIPEFSKQECLKQFLNQNSQSLCIRNLIAAERSTKALKHESLESMIGLDQMDYSEVTETDLGYSWPNCRLRTHFEGAVCNIDTDTISSLTDETSGSCHPKNGHNVGSRPRCWFAPKQ